jgi:hypothetical protein
VDTTGVRAWTSAGAGLMAAVLVTLGVAGCGGEDDSSTGGDTAAEAGGDSAGAGDSGDAGASTGGQSSDLCSLLTTAEVEEQFGEAGAVAEPHIEYGSCVWEIGEQGDDGTGDLVSLYRSTGDGSRSLAENWGTDLSDGEMLDGVGDEAWISSDGSYLLLQHGDVLVSLSSAFGSVLGSDLSGVREKMIALAELVVSRI